MLPWYDDNTSGNESRIEYILLTFSDKYDKNIEKIHKTLYIPFYFWMIIEEQVSISCIFQAYICTKKKWNVSQEEELVLLNISISNIKLQILLKEYSKEDFDRWIYDVSKWYFNLLLKYNVLML